MALCTSCGSEVDEAASFCTSCGQRTSSSHAGSTITVTRPICSGCGAQVDLGSVFCTNCGQRMAQPAVIEETAPSPAKTEPAPAASVMAPSQTPRAIEFSSAEPAKAPAPASAETAVASPASPVTAPEDAVTQPAPSAAPQIAPPIYATPTEYPPAQSSGGAFHLIVLILLLLIVFGAFGGWYFWGVETVIVCSPPDVRVFVDDKELHPSSYGRYVIPHLSRQSHLLRVQRPGFADTLQRLDFSLASLHEWVNIKLVPSRRPQR